MSLFPHLLAGPIMRDAAGGAVGMVSLPLAAKALAQARFRGAMAMNARGVLADPGVKARAAKSAEVFSRLQAGDVYLSRIAVSEAARGSGVGHARLHECFARAAHAGATRVVLDVAAAHEGAKRFYARVGFACVGEKAIEEAGATLAYSHWACGIDELR